MKERRARESATKTGDRRDIETGAVNNNESMYGGKSTTGTEGVKGHRHESGVTTLHVIAIASRKTRERRLVDRPASTLCVFFEAHLPACLPTAASCPSDANKKILRRRTKKSMKSVSIQHREASGEASTLTETIQSRSFRQRLRKGGRN